MKNGLFKITPGKPLKPSMVSPIKSTEQKEIANQNKKEIFEINISQIIIMEIITSSQYMFDILFRIEFNLPLNSNKDSNAPIPKASKQLIGKVS